MYDDSPSFHQVHITFSFLSLSVFRLCSDLVFQPRSIPRVQYLKAVRSSTNEGQIKTQIETMSQEYAGRDPLDIAKEAERDLNSTRAQQGDPAYGKGDSSTAQDAGMSNSPFPAYTYLFIQPLFGLSCSLRQRLTLTCTQTQKQALASRLNPRSQAQLCKSAPPPLAAPFLPTKVATSS